MKLCCQNKIQKIYHLVFPRKSKELALGCDLVPEFVARALRISRLPRASNFNEAIKLN